MIRSTESLSLDANGPTKPLRILLTNNTLEQRGGTELVVLELAIKLKQLGMLPVAYSPHLGEVAEDLRRAGVPVIQHLNQLQVMPDIIHGHHHLETMTACLKFPDVPAISFCHGWLPWEEMPPTFPSIQHYVAIGETTRERILTEVRLDGRPVSILRTFFDDDRFHERSQTNIKPLRALIYNNSIAKHHSICATLLEACRPRGIALQLCGVAAGNTTKTPEVLLPNYDVVFATGRSALEAMACGCAVIVCDANGCAGLLRPNHFDGDRIALLELSARAGRTVTSSYVGRQIDLYDAFETSILARHVRKARSLTAATGMVMNLYRTVLAQAARHPIAARDQQLSDASDYIAQLSARLKGR